jgi:hypothetical protein
VHTHYLSGLMYFSSARVPIYRFPRVCIAAVCLSDGKDSKHRSYVPEAVGRSRPAPLSPLGCSSTERCHLQSVRVPPRPLRSKRARGWLAISAHTRVLCDSPSLQTLHRYTHTAPHRACDIFHANSGSAAHRCSTLMCASPRRRWLRAALGTA